MVKAVAGWHGIAMVKVTCPYALTDVESYGLKPMPHYDNLYTGKARDIRRFVSDWKE